MDDMQPTPVTPEPAQPAETTPTDDLPDWAKDPAKVVAMVRDLRKENADHRKAKQSAESAAQQAETARLAEQGEFKKLYEEATRQLTELQSQLKASQVQALRSKVASELGIPPQLAERLRGETEEEMKQDAESLKAVIPTPSASGTRQTTTAVPGGQPAKKTSREVYQEVMSGGNRNPFGAASGGLLIMKKE